MWSIPWHCQLGQVCHAGPNFHSAQARRGVAAATAERESFVAPLAAPRLPPGRLYFLFQQPIQTSPEDLKVKPAELAAL